MRLGRIVRVLMDHAMVMVSGTKIGEEIGTGRSEVWRLIQQLRSLGVEVDGHPATGYRLRSVPDLLLADVVAPLVKGTLFSQIQHYYKIGSTNEAAMDAAAAGAPEGSVFLAEEQTAGKGRGGNQWHSARSSGIYCSVVLRPNLPPSEALVLSLATGLAVRSAIRAIDSRMTPDLKWPNDVLLDGKKFCGILTEMNAEATRVRHVVIGIGINVNQQKFPEEFRETATSLLLASGSEWSRVELTAALLKSLDREYRDLLEGARRARFDFAPLQRGVLVCSRPQSPHRGKRRLRRRHRRARHARLPAGSHRTGIANRFERNGARAVISDSHASRH